MSIDQFALPAMIVAAVAGGVIMTVQILGVCMYDAAEVRRERAIRLHPHARAYRRRPLITALVSSHNDTETIRHTLDSLLQGSYRNVEVIVIDHGSTDMTKRIVKGYADMHAKRSIRLVARRQDRDRSGSVARAMKRYGNGELVMTLPAGSTVDKDALVHAVQQFAYNPSIQAVNCNEQVGRTLTVAGLLEKYQMLLSRRPHKFLSAFGWLKQQGRVAVCRADAFMLQPRKLRIRYASNVGVVVPALVSYRAVFLSAYRRYVQLLRENVGRRESLLRMTYALCSAIVSMSGPWLIAYFLYIALYLHEPTLLFLTVTGLSAFLLVAIGEAGQLKLWQKAAYAFCIPVTYVLFYLLSFSRLFAIGGAVLTGTASRGSKHHPVRS